MFEVFASYNDILEGGSQDTGDVIVNQVEDVESRHSSANDVDEVFIVWDCRADPVKGNSVNGFKERR